MTLRWRSSLALGAAFLAAAAAEFLFIRSGRLATGARIREMFAADFWHNRPLLVIACHFPDCGGQGADAKRGGGPDQIIGKTQR